VRRERGGGRVRKERGGGRVRREREGRVRIEREEEGG
jgi:hypothetical protein